MAGHLQRAGHPLFVWARRPESVGDLAATRCATPAELGRCCDVVFTVVTSSADVEGLALAPQGRRGGWLIASSQGDNAYALYALPDMRPAGRFRVGAGSLGATEETDGIDLALGSFGTHYRGGLLVVQDGDNAPAAQNFKLIAWRDVLMALKAAAGRR